MMNIRREFSKKFSFKIAQGQLHIMLIRNIKGSSEFLPLVGFFFRNIGELFRKC